MNLPGRCRITPTSRRTGGWCCVSPGKPPRARSSASAFREAALQFQRGFESIGKQGQSRTLNESPSTSGCRRAWRQRHLAARVWIEYAKEAEEMAAAIADPTRELTAIINRARR